MKKIAHIMRRCSTERWGGTESVVHNLSKQFEKQGIRSPIYTTDMLSKPGVETIEGVDIHRFPYIFPWLSLSDEAKKQLELKGGNPLSLPLFKSLYEEPDLDLIHVHVQHRLGGVARTVAQMRGIPYVVSIHGGMLTLPQDQISRMSTPFRGHLEWGKAVGWLLGAHKTIEDASAVVCVGRDEHKLMLEKYPHKKIVYIPNGVDTPLFAEANPWDFWKRYRKHEKEKFILCVSRIDSQKNQKLLMKSFASFQKHFPYYRLVLIGGISVESYYQELIELQAELDLQNKVILIPGLPPGDPMLTSAYAACDQFVLPSRNEPFGIVILEAWAAGKPVIASAVGGVPGFTKDGENVLWFESESEAGLYRALCRLATDDVLRAKLTVGGKSEVEKYSWDSVSRQYLELYKISTPSKGTRILYKLFSSS